MFMKFGENGPETSPQSVCGGGDNWYPVVVAPKKHFNPYTQTIRYELVDGVVYERVEGDPNLLYHQARRREYPDVRDQLDALWKGGADLEAMRQKVMAVKEKFPKPVGGDNAQG
jgi:hypothetical protein